ncbi:leuA [Acrasis kona]|uniref:LeuA n=1 Tax=Acrasis kona TaxID=1008807 RepID=A0AAW2YTW4_9EUKA
MLKLRQIEERDFSTLIQLEESIFPTGACTNEILSQIYLSQPYRAQFGMMYDDEKDKKLCAMCAFLPLNAIGYNKLKNGVCRELELDEYDYFTLDYPDKSQVRTFEIALHVYHIDKLRPIPKLYQRVFEDVTVVVENLTKLIKKLYHPSSTLNVLCFSAYAVTKEGVNLFENILGWTPNIHFPITEHLMFKKDQEQTKWLLVEGPKDQVISFNQEWSYSNQCKFLTTHCYETGIAWGLFKKSKL